MAKSTPKASPIPAGDSEHQAKIEQLRALTLKRELLLRSLHDAIKIVIDIGDELTSLDAVEVAPLMSGCDTYFSIKNRLWADQLLRFLARASIGVERGVEDKTKPVLSVIDHGKALHSQMVAELIDRPNARRMETLRASGALISEPPVECAPGHFSPDHYPSSFRHGGNAVNYTANGELKKPEPKNNIANGEPRPEPKPAPKPEPRLSTDVLEEPYE